MSEIKEIKEIKDAIEAWKEEKRQIEFAYGTMHIKKELKLKRLKFYDSAIQALTEKLEWEQMPNKNCESCNFNENQWDEEPCYSCICLVNSNWTQNGGTEL